MNQFSEIANYYNIPVINFIQYVFVNTPERHPFPVIDDIKEFLIKISEEIMDETPKLDNLITKEDENNDRIILNDFKEINLKKFVIDEMGYALNDLNNDPNYSYYINTEEKMFYVNIELPGGGTIKRDIKIAGSNYYFIFEGIKKGDEAIENDKINQTKKLIKIKNLRKSKKFKLTIIVPCSYMIIIPGENKLLKQAGQLIKDGKGIYTYKYYIKILGDEKEENEVDILD